MAELKWTTEALDWLEEIYRYIAQDNPEAAAQVVDGIYEKAQVLIQHPGIGTRLRQVEEGDVRLSCMVITALLTCGTTTMSLSM